MKQSKESKPKNIDLETGEIVPIFKTASGLIYKPRSGWKQTDTDLHHPKGESMTVQNQAFSVRDLLSKQARGLNVTVPAQAINFDQDLDGIDMQKLANADIFEKEQIVLQSQLRAQSAKKEIERLEEERKKPAAPAA